MNGEPVFVTLVTGQVVRATLTTEHPASSYGWPVPVPELRERPTEDAEGRDIREFVDAATGEVVLCDEWRECQDAQ